jgi:predicted XRE-type DNA-binding protein
MSKKDNWPSEAVLKVMRKRLSKGIASRPLPENASLVDKIKYSICEEILKYKLKHNFTQRQIAEQIGENESLVSKIVHYHIDEFTIDRLLKYLNVIYPDTKFKLKVA